MKLRQVLFEWLESRIQFDKINAGGMAPGKSVWAFIWFHLADIKWWLLAVFIASFLFSVFEAALFLSVGWAIDFLNKTNPEKFLQEYGIVSFGILSGIVLVRPLLFFISHALVDQVVVPSITNRIRWNSHNHTINQPIGYFNDDLSGRLVARVVHSGDSVRGASIDIIDNVSYVLVFCIVSSIYFGTLSSSLVWVLATWAALFFALVVYFTGEARSRSELNSSSRSLVTARLVDSYTNIATVKIFAQHETENEHVHSALGAWVKSFQNLTRLTTGILTLLQLLNSLLLAMMGALTVWLWTKEEISLGAIAATMGLVLRIVGMSGWILNLFRGVFENVGSTQEAMKSLAASPTIPTTSSVSQLKLKQGCISFRDVTYGYKAGHNVLSNFSLDIKGGEKLGIIGPSGAGKSTIVDLLLRLYELKEGRIELDGQNIADVTASSLRGAFAVVSQNTPLLNRSIYDNIAYGRPDAAEEEVYEAARLARAWDFVMEIRDNEGNSGFASHVGERGVKLSGGQRQRIAIARAILKNAPILVLDEATSALDIELEAAIQDNLGRLMKDRTAVVIAHRLTTISALDRIISLEAGRITEQGTHDELISSNGIYSRLWKTQGVNSIQYTRSIIS